MTTMEIGAAMIDGQPGAELIVRNAYKTAGMIELCESLGIVCTPDIANRRSRMCATEAELVAARAPLMSHIVDGSLNNGIVELR